MRITPDHFIAVTSAAEDAGLARYTEPDGLWVLGPELTALRERMRGDAPGGFAWLTPEEAQAMEALIGMD